MFCLFYFVCVFVGCTQAWFVWQLLLSAFICVKCFSCTLYTYTRNSICSDSCHFFSIAITIQYLSVFLLFLWLGLLLLWSDGFPYAFLLPKKCAEFSLFCLLTLYQSTSIFAHCYYRNAVSIIDHFLSLAAWLLFFLPDHENYKINCPFHSHNASTLSTRLRCICLRCVVC